MGNGGKTYDFFRTAPQRFPWATHIAKCDMDVFPHLKNLARYVYDQRGCTSEYEFFGLASGQVFGTESSWSRSCTADACMQKQIGRWYMQGGLYGLSRKLAIDATAPESPW